MELDEAKPALVPAIGTHYAVLLLYIYTCIRYYEYRVITAGQLGPNAAISGIEALMGRTRSSSGSSPYPAASRGRARRRPREAMLAPVKVAMRQRSREKRPEIAPSFWNG
jgi:hypothetical protein